MTVAKEVLSHFHLPLLSCLGLVIFMGVFLGAVFWVNRKGSDSFYQSLGTMPLKDEGEYE